MPARLRVLGRPVWGAGTTDRCREPDISIEGYRWHGYGRDTPIALSTLLLATPAVCGVYGGDHSTPR
jgi:hypothetical protein